MLSCWLLMQAVRVTTALMIHQATLQLDDIWCKPQQIEQQLWMHRSDQKWRREACPFWYQ